MLPQNSKFFCTKSVDFLFSSQFCKRSAWRKSPKGIPFWRAARDNSDCNGAGRARNSKKIEATQGQSRGFQSQKIRHVTIQKLLVRAPIDRKFNPVPKASRLDTAKKKVEPEPTWGPLREIGWGGALRVPRSSPKSFPETSAKSCFSEGISKANSQEVEFPSDKVHSTPLLVKRHQFLPKGSGSQIYQ